MDIPSYLARISYAGATAPTLATLSALMKAHLLSVPFENLDIHRGVAIDLDKVFDKVVRRRRGGFTTRKPKNSAPNSTTSSSSLTCTAVNTSPTSASGSLSSPRWRSPPAKSTTTNAAGTASKRMTAPTWP